MFSNRTPRHGNIKVRLINAVDYSAPMRKNLGIKRNFFADEHIQQIIHIFTEFAESRVSKIFDNPDFGFTKVTVERPARTPTGDIKTDRKGNPVPDTALRDYEKIPLKEDIEAYFLGEVLPHVPDAWMDRSKDKIGYEISFTKYFYEYTPLRSLEDIKADILALEAETDGLLGEILEL